MKNKNTLWIIGIIIVVLIVVGGVYLFAKNSYKSEKEICLESGGYWGKIGHSIDEECKFLTPDSGKICSSSEQCSGKCLLSPEDYMGNCSYFYDGCKKCEENGGKCIDGKAVLGTYDTCNKNISTGDGGKPCKDDLDCNNICIPADEGRYGKCSSYKNVVGCLYVVENGRVEFVCYD